MRQLMMTMMPGSISCKEVDEKLDDYVEGDISLWNRFRVGTHFVMCEACRIYAVSYRKTIDVMRGSIAGPDDPTADEVVSEELVQDILNKQNAGSDTE